MSQPPTQQKRQNSMSNYVVNSSNKRTPNPLQMPMTMQSPQEYLLYNSNSPPRNNPNVISSPSTPHMASPRFMNSSLMTNNSSNTINRGAQGNPAPNGNGGSIRRNLAQQHQQSLLNNLKTPTPSAYDVPSSPNINTSAQNNLDLPDSNPMDQSTQETEFLRQKAAQQAAEAQAQAQAQALVQQRTMSEEEQQLATKLKETYKNIVNYEEIVQKSCIEITIKINNNNSNPNNENPNNIYNQQLSTSVASSSSIMSNPVRTSEISDDLWTVYHHNITLLDNYYDFLVTALKPSSSQNQVNTGKNIVDLYKIPRRMWVYGIVGFLEVLKNINIFQDHEICSCFIAYCFNVISNLTDPALEMKGWWCEKLGDLSRMAIALYSSRFIDWKVSAEYWYSISMKTLYGHGKIYYHMCTVQQDNLDALVNIGKSVICRDPFVPTQQYLRLVVENICTQRNILSVLELPIIDFIKIHKVLLSIHNTSSQSNNNNGSSGNDTNNSESIHDSQLQYGIDLVTRYGLTFGSDSNGYNFFTKTLYAPTGIPNDPNHPYYQQQQSSNSNTIEKMNFWFNKGPLFAIANINHLIGFGDAKNPFAKIFQLPEALKERKDKKDRKRKSRGSSSTQNPEELKKLINNVNSTTNNDNFSIISNSGVDGQTITASDLSVNDWFYCLNYINKSVLELSFRILNNYLVGPKQASTCHVIVWLYFLISVGEATNRYPNSQNMFLWLFRKLFPWESFINYLNSLVTVSKNNGKLHDMCRKYLLEHPNYIQYFNENEFLPEVWKCWGTLWFDFISSKGDYNDLEGAGVKNPNIFDLPICGTSPIVNMTNSTSDKRSGEQSEHDNDERIVRIVLLARFLADNYKFGLVRTKEGFKFDANVYNDIDLLVSSDPNHSNIPYARIEEFLFSDGRLVQNNFLTSISPENLITSTNMTQLSAYEKDDFWFKLSAQDSSVIPDDDEVIEIGDDIVDEEDLDGYADSEFDEEEEDYGNGNNNNGGNDTLQQHHLYHQQHHQQAIQQANRQLGTNGDDYYNDNFIVTSDSIQSITEGNRASIEGDLGDRMDSAITYISLDTNIWLRHCGRIFKCIRNGVFKILMPLIVFQELRSLRKSTEATVADAATRSVIIIRELYLTKEILPLRFDGTIANDINETTEFENNSNWRNSVDETILNSVNEHDEIGKKLMKGLNTPINGPPHHHGGVIVLNSKTAKIFRYSILVTDDRNMRLRAKTIGLASFHSKWLFGQLELVFGDKCID